MVAVEGAGDYLSASDECKRGSRWDLWVRAKKTIKFISILIACCGCVRTTNELQALSTLHH